MLYVVIERYRRGAEPVYERLRAGRQLPPGLTYLDSWVVDEPEIRRCFQLMEAETPAALSEWTERWSDLVEFEVLPVIGSSEAARRVDAVEGIADGA